MCQDVIMECSLLENTGFNIKPLSQILEGRSSVYLNYIYTFLYHGVFLTEQSLLKQNKRWRYKENKYFYGIREHYIIFF